ncbi:MAG: ketol-acid reductoisomerase [Rhodothermales bacterium]|nr:ketol-acid reductoisomerase [Rhodothermales bacterium]
MADILFDEDPDLSAVDGRTVAVIGYGNQGRSQAFNMRDSGLTVIIGGIEDESLLRARDDGFETTSISEAVDAADIIFLLLPDEIQREVYAKDLEAPLRSGHTLNFAHGYNVRFGYIHAPDDIDVIMVAPRMIGVGVRELFVSGSGSPAFVAVEQDATGRAWPTAIALAGAIGCTRGGVLRTTFAEETELDLFSEQAIWPSILKLLTLSYEVLTERGYQPEAVVMEAYASREPARVFDKMAELGIFRQTRLHSRTSQFGTLTRMETVLPKAFRLKLEQTIDAIRSGDFSAEWETERGAGYPEFNRLHTEARRHPINDVEDRLRPAAPPVPLSDEAQS